MIDVDVIQSQVPRICDLTSLGRGGQKMVFRGRHENHGDIVLKILFSSQPDERVMREIEIATKCNIPHTAKIYEWGTFQYDEGTHFYIIEQLIDGVTLRQELKLKHTLSIRTVLSLIGALLDAAAAMEKERIVHRDIKPENIMACGDGTFRLLDFGIARHLAKTSLTPTEARFGPHTPGYAAPEQFRNIKKDVDIRADLFSVGVVAYECLSGNHPFSVGARDHLDILRRTETVAPPPLVLAESPETEFSNFISILMAKYPSRRPPTAAAAKVWFESIRATIESRPQER